MKLKENEFGIGTFHKDVVFKDALVITREALERLWEECQHESSNCINNGKMAQALQYTGEANAYRKLLRLFDNDDNLEG